jgi:hypothetical protein
MSNSKQSSVDWLFNKMITEKHTISEWNEIKKQAKAMHKEEIKESLQEFIDITLSDEICEEYYNETYGGNNEQ